MGTGETESYHDNISITVNDDKFGIMTNFQFQWMILI